MSNERFKNLDTGKVGLIQQDDDGSIVQIALTQDQSEMLQYFLAMLSMEKPLVKMGPEYNLKLNNE